MKVSVIIPVYNTEAYLRECLDSVLCQRCGELEILLIDDGSDDGSGAICDAYAQKHPHIRVIHTDRNGPGAARNLGLQLAKGEYIVFADADDFFATGDSIGQLTALLDHTDADVAVGNYCRLWDGHILEATKHCAFSGMGQGSGNFRFRGFFSVGTLSYVWGKAYRCSFLKEHGIVFGDYEYAEDKFFNFQCYGEQARYGFTDHVVYTYRKNDASISHLVQQDRAECWLKISADLLEYLEGKGLSEAYGDLVAYTVNFAAFFDGKALYCRSGRKMGAVKALLQKYVASDVANRCFGQLSRGKYLASASGAGWKLVMWAFACLMRLRALGTLSFGIKLLIDWKIDERLSDTGLKKSK